jgi:hypothetical protein
MGTISQLFASVEEFIREKNYPKALLELSKVYQIDPKNYYAQAFSDRIRTLIQAESASKEIKKTPIPTLPSSESYLPPSANHVTRSNDDAPR